MHRTHWIKRRNWLIRELQALPEGTLNRLLAFSEQLAKNKNELPEALEIMTTWLRDLAVEKVHAGKIRNRDLTQTVKSEAQKNSLASLLAKIDIVQAAGSTIKAGTNVRLAMEAMMLKLARV
jgi:DNA polymerase III gamma/tau subunit